uniref:Uncharacterized protein n=1 Tax=viral metagenome TaxID=1070528 RepID=A0A6C0JAE3_9ZZZZ
MICPSTSNNIQFFKFSVNNCKVFYKNNYFILIINKENLKWIEQPNKNFKKN